MSWTHDPGDGVFGSDPHEALAALLNAPAEPLDDELAACVVAGPLGPAIKHPLVVAPVYGPQMNALYNAQLRSKQDEVAAAAAAGDVERLVWLHERPWRAEVFAASAGALDDREYWRLVARVWVDSENIVEMVGLWDELLRAPRAGRESTMTRHERDALAALPERVEIFQGHTQRRDDGWSWTTERSVAVWFARRFALLEGARPRLSRAFVARSNVTAYLLSRGEFEVLVAPEFVEDRTTGPVVD